MKKVLKKGLSILLTLILIISIFSINSNAINVEDLIAENNMIINEWDEYKRIISKTDHELIELGYTKEEIVSIRNFDYEEEIRNRAALDNQTLQKYGYTNEEITVLRKAAVMDDIQENFIK